MNKVIKQLLGQYDLQSTNDIKFSFAEILQKVILACLSKIGFFKEAVFCGGTSLRILHGLNRFSEDLDFNLTKPDKDFKWSNYSKKLIDTLKQFDLEFDIKLEKNETNIAKAMLVTNLYNLVKQLGDEKYLNNIRPNQTLKIKLEVDTNPPKVTSTDIEDKLLYEPIFCKVTTFKLETLFAGKLNAILTRSTYTKGRDYYDYLFYMSKHVSPNLNYLQYSLSQFKIWNNKEEFKIEYLRDMLRNKFKSLDIDLVKKDVAPLIKNQDELDAWSNEIFILTLKDLK